MNKLLLLLFLLSGMQTAFAQHKILDSLHNELARTENLTERFAILNRITDINNFQGGNIDSATTVEMLQIAEELNNDSLLSVCYNLIGLYFLNKGENNSSLEYLIKAIPLAEISNDKRRLSSLYFDISLVYFNLHSYEEAYENIIKGGENLPDRSFKYYDYMLIQFERNMTLYFILKDRPDSALHYSQALLETSNRIKSTVYEYAANYLNGSVYSMMGNNELAEVFFDKAIAVSDSIKEPEEKLKFYDNYLNFLLKNDRIAEAQEQAMQLKNLADQSNDLNLKLAGAGYLRKVYDKLNNTDSAYHYAMIEMQINDEIFSENNVNKIQALAFNERIRVIEENAKMIEEEEARRQRIQYLLLALSIISVVILYITFSHRIISNPEKVEYFGILALLIVFEFVNLILHPLLGTITHHNPILMLLGLVCIAAFLVPIHHKSEKWIKGYLAEKNKKILIENEKKIVNRES